MAIAAKHAELQRLARFSNISTEMDESNTAQVSCGTSGAGGINEPSFLTSFFSSFFMRSAKTLSKIETHLDTSNATEAWILLAIVAPNIKGHNPERISKLLLTNLKYDMVSAGKTISKSSNAKSTTHFLLLDKYGGKLLH